ncbi:MAG TPA: MFS transporter [Bacteroidota bacterium]|nr:MFS transporter [Bacteroidota bacterium]
MIKTVGFALYFREIIALNSPRGDLYWGFADSISMLTAAVLSPILGAASDYARRKKSFLLFFSLLCILFTSLLFFLRPGMIVTGMLLFIIANVGFEGGYAFYDSFLPQITTEEHYGRVSGYGFAMGYLGALAILAISFPLIQGGFAEENLLSFRFSFILTALFFLVFALPFFLIVKEQHRTGMRRIPYIRLGIRQTFRTIRHIRGYRNIVRFLIAFFLYIDAVNTVIFFAAIFARVTLHFTELEVIIFFIVTQSTAILGAVLFGFVTDRVGPKRTISITLLLWMVVIAGAFFTGSKAGFYAVGLLAGVAIGSSQSSSRSLMARLLPPEHEAEFFGFYDGICGNASAIIGPTVFGIISAITGSQRLAILSIGFFFLSGFLFLQKVREPHARSADHLPAPENLK